MYHLTQHHPTATEPVKLREYVPGASDPADSLNLEMMSDEEYRRMSDGLLAFQEDGSSSSDGASSCSSLSTLGGRELTATDIDGEASSSPMYAAPFDPSLRSTTHHNAGSDGGSGSGAGAPAVGTGGGSGGGGGGEEGVRNKEEKENGSGGQQRSRVRYPTHCSSCCWFPSLRNGSRQKRDTSQARLLPKGTAVDRREALPELVEACVMLFSTRCVATRVLDLPRWAKISHQPWQAAYIYLHHV